MKLYLDNSFLNRPFDSQEVGQNKLESETLITILDSIEIQEVTLVNSPIIELENSLNPIPERKAFVEKAIAKATIYQKVNEKIRDRALEIEKEMTITSIDALHIATAEASKVDFFITCDYNLARRYKGDIKVVTPLKFFQYYGSNN